MDFLGVDKDYTEVEEQAWKQHKAEVQSQTTKKIYFNKYRWITQRRPVMDRRNQIVVTPAPTANGPPAAAKQTTSAVGDDQTVAPELASAASGGHHWRVYSCRYIEQLSDTYLTCI